jgi:hypothetical protein
MGTDTKNRNIVRIDIESATRRSQTHGWQVRLSRRGEKLSKFFSDAKHGGKRKALDQARIYRDEAELKLPKMTRFEFAQRKTSRNTSGVVGVHYSEAQFRKRGKVYPTRSWVATWSISPGVARSRRFSVDKLGADKAFKAAVKYRADMLKLIKGDAPDAPVEVKKRKPTAG